MVGSFTGQFYNTVSGAAPEISVSAELDLVTIYGKINVSGFFAKAKKFNYFAKISLDVTFPGWVTESEATLQVSDTFIYVRNAIKHGALSVDNNGAGVYFSPVILDNN